MNDLIEDLAQQIVASARLRKKQLAEKAPKVSLQDIINFKVKAVLADLARQGSNLSSQEEQRLRVRIRQHLGN